MEVLFLYICAVQHAWPAGRRVSECGRSQLSTVVISVLLQRLRALLRL